MFDERIKELEKNDELALIKFMNDLKLGRKKFKE